MTFVFEQSGTPRRLSSNAEHQLLRIGQEAVLNAVRHSGSPSVTMHLHYDEDAVMLTIKDAGHGFDTSHPTSTGDHYGLVTMRERAQSRWRSVDHIESRTRNHGAGATAHSSARRVE